MREIYLLKIISPKVYPPLGKFIQWGIIYIEAFV